MNPISFDTKGLEVKADDPLARVWHTDSGDGVGLYYFPLPPDIEADLLSIDAVREFYRTKCAQMGQAIIEVDTPTVDECLAVRTIIKAPQQPAGMAYVGAITFPFRDCSFVVKVQCHELGFTGFREAIVFEQLLRDGRIRIDQEGQTVGWMQDPYDLAFQGPLARNMAEDETFDGDFPEHPLSRARSLLKRIQDSLHVAQEVKMMPKFSFDPIRKARG